MENNYFNHVIFNFILFSNINVMKKNIGRSIAGNVKLNLD